MAMRPVERLRWVDVDGEALVLELDTGTLHLLDRQATAVWRRLDGATSLTDISERVADEFGADPRAVERDVVSLVETLQQRSLVHNERQPGGRQTNLGAGGQP
jgi:Coenzyme PQQ synthesis protein D (PqqD)